LPSWQAYDGKQETILRIGTEAGLKARPLPDLSLFE
jgi:hypothetical protein